ncbi:MAG: hypothetical protein AAF654_01720 [Myxococcota bacterium]
MAVFRWVFLALLFACAAKAGPTEPMPEPAKSTFYEDLVTLFKEWRAFETPPLRNGAPDYTEARLTRAHAQLPSWRARLNAIDASGWPIPQQIDWHLLRAEMNGFDFNCRVLRPWTRDPAFYKSVWSSQSDTPAHEGPMHHAPIELWQYEFPLSDAAAQKLSDELKTVPPLLEQARLNLTGNAFELWVAGFRDIRSQERTLAQLEAKVPKSVKPALIAARDATSAMIDWMQTQTEKKTGPSGIGKDDYTWYLQNVHLVPLTWEDEVRLLQRELDRAWTSLKLEEHRNRALPEAVAAMNAEEYDAQADDSASYLMRFLEEKDVMPVKANMEPALREHLGQFVPSAIRNFFWITAHFDPTPLYTHFYHWWDLAQMRDEPHPSPLRREALLYNIWDSRAEGTATGVEEMFLHAGLYDERPRSREIVWIMLAQRAARGLGSLHAHANAITMEEAGEVHMDWTPRGWMRTERELLIFEQHLYLRQPGYGTSYVTGKYLFEKLVAKYAQQRDSAGKPFVLKEFFREFNDVGLIPMSLIHWQMTGSDELVPGR